MLLKLITPSALNKSGSQKLLQSKMKVSETNLYLIQYTNILVALQHNNYSRCND
jgi:hypothetical protein